MRRPGYLHGLNDTWFEAKTKAEEDAMEDVSSSSLVTSSGAAHVTSYRIPMRALERRELEEIKQIDLQKVLRMIGY